MMLSRRRQMVELINQKGQISLMELSQAFPGLSEMTLRKDLKALDDSGQVVRIHGGARSLMHIISGDAPLSSRMMTNQLKKQLIAQKAVPLVRPGASVFLDSGSTMTEFAKVYPDHKGIVFCAGLTCLNELSRLSQPDLYVLGGLLNKPSKSVRDAGLLPQIAQLHFDLAFISVNGYTRQSGFNCLSSARWAIQQAIFDRSDQVIVLMDSRKVGRLCPFALCHPDRVDILVSDGDLPPEELAYLRKQGVQVL